MFSISDECFFFKLENLKVWFWHIKKNFVKEMALTFAKFQIKKNQISSKISNLAKSFYGWMLMHRSQNWER